MKKFFVLLCAVMLVMGFALSASAEYYLYGDFTTSNSEFKGGYDVDSYVNSYENNIYVNRDGIHIDHYTVTLHDTDGDGYMEPDQHPDNIGPDGISGTSDDAVGPMEERTLAFVETYDVSAMGAASRAEIYAAADGLYFLDDSDAVQYFKFSDSSLTPATNGFPGGGSGMDDLSFLSRASDGTFWAGNEDREIYSYDGSNWNYEFSFAGFSGGGHGDGMEIAFNANGDERIYVSDMNADYLGEYDFNGTLKNTYSYPGGGSSMAVEGLGFGALGHFWVTGSNHLYEIGGGDLGGTHDGSDPVPEPSTILLMGIGLLGLAGYSRKKKSCKN